MEIKIDGFDFWNMEAMKYWSHPKTYDPARKKTECRNMVMSGEYLGSRKMDGIWGMIIVDANGKVHLRARTEGVNGGYVDKAEWIPHIVRALGSVPAGTVVLGEIYLPDNEGSRKTTSVLNCLKDKCLERQQKSGWLHFYVFDVLAYDGHSLLNNGFDKRISYYLYVKLKEALACEYVEIADYKEGEELWALYGEVLAAGGEGIVITQKTCPYMPGKRKARMTVKLKKELSETIDAFYDGDYKLATKTYTGKDIESWPYWMNTKTGEKSSRCMYPEYARGEAWEPVTRAFYYGWASAISFSVMKDGKPYRIGYISGITDEVKQGVVENPDAWIGKVGVLNAMEIECIEGAYSLRHGRLNEWRTDKTAADCTFDQIASS